MTELAPLNNNTTASTAMGENMSPTAVAAPPSLHDDSEIVVLEDYLSKQGSRSKNFWHDRYFVLTADGTLRYYKKKAGEMMDSGSKDPQLLSASLTTNHTTATTSTPTAAASSSSLLKPKASLVLNRLPDCEVSELYVAKSKHTLLYCVKITWSAEAAAATADLSDAESVLSGGPPVLTMQSQKDSNDDADTVGERMDGGAGEEETNPTNTTTNTTSAPSNKMKKLKKSIFRKSKKKDKKDKQQQSDRDDGSIVSNTNEPQHPPQASGVFRTPPRDNSSRKLRHTNNSNNTTPAGRSAEESLNNGAATPTALSNALSNDEEFDGVPAIPEMVEVEEETGARDVHNNNNDGESARNQELHRSASHTSQQPLATTQPGYSRLAPSRSNDDEDDEMEYLRAQFMATEKEKKRITKRKVADGAKVAAATGAAVGIAVVTVGIGLVAGLVALGVGAAAGASGTATGLAWKKKKEGQIILGSSDYEKMRRWKACLDASLNSGILQKSKWGQAFIEAGGQERGRSNKRRMLIFPKAQGQGAAGGTPALNSGDNLLLPFPSPDSGASYRDGGGGSPLFFSESTLHAKWKPVEGGWTSFLGTGPQGLRIFQEEVANHHNSAKQRRKQTLFRNYQSVDGRPCPPMKAHLVLSATPLDAFLCLMSHGQLSDHGTQLTPNSGQRSSFRILESIDDNTDVIHLVCNPLYLFPSWTSPRDFVLYRYWRLEEDGSFIVCYESVQHKNCPPLPGYCRGEMHQVFTVAPHKKTQRRKGGSTSKDQLHECLMTAVVQVDPKGWIPVLPLNLFSNQGYADAFSVAALIQLLDIRDAIDQDRFVPVSLDDNNLFHHNSPNMMDPKFASTVNNNDNIPRIDSMGSDRSFNDDLVNYDFSFANREIVGHHEEATSFSTTGLALSPPPLALDRWAEPDPNSFRVRGQLYKEDRKKINAGASIGRLVAVDIVQVDAPIYSGMTMHPTERVQLALQKEASLKEGEISDMPAFVFVVNIVVPGPPFFHGVFYYAIDDMSKIDGSDGTPSSLLCKEFLFGESDAFRDKTFKLIPQIVQGNFIVRKAVGSTPAIMGKKLKQTYVRTDRSFEVVLDCGSSPVATGVIRLSLGYAKTLVVDMGFLFEGDSEEYLPERLMGCARIRQMDFNANLRKVEPPPPTESPNPAETTASASTTTQSASS